MSVDVSSNRAPGFRFRKTGRRPSFWAAKRLGFFGLGLGWLIFSFNLTPVSAQPRARQVPPPSPPLTSPVDVFRQLLAMTPAEQARALTNRPPAIRARILAKLRQYEALEPDERELRLRATELRWYLLPLMSLPQDQRPAQLARIPDPEMRRLVQQRLAEWNLLPPTLQKELLNSDTTADYFSRLETATEEEKRQILSHVPPGQRAQLESGLARWRQMSEDQRRRMLAGFNQFFQLTPSEKQKALQTLSPAERRQMQKTLAAYSKLTPAQRIQCIRSFEKFASMDPAERLQFLKNAQRWEAMSPREREAWRQAVRLAPLMPPGLGTPPPPGRRRAPAAAVATN